MWKLANRHMRLEGEDWGESGRCRARGQQDATVWIILIAVASRWTVSWGMGDGRHWGVIYILLWAPFLGRRRMGSRLPFCISLCLPETLSSDSSWKKDEREPRLPQALPQQKTLRPRAVALSLTHLVLRCIYIFYTTSCKLFTTPCKLFTEEEL